MVSILPHLALDRGPVIPKPTSIRVLRFMPAIVTHITAIVRFDIGIAPRPVSMVMHRLLCSALLLRIVKLPISRRAHLTPLGKTPLRRRVHFRVSTMVKLNVGVAAGTVRMVDSGFTRNLENLASVHILK